MIIAMSPAIQSKRTHDGRLFKVDVLSWTDEQGVEVIREVVRHPGAVTVVPILDDGGIVMIHNHRIAVNETLWELPAGKLEPGEAPETAAGRELSEETGYVCKQVIPLGSFYTSPGFADELMHAFIARGLTQTVQRLEPGENITVQVRELPEVLEMIHRGEIRDGKTIAGLLMYWTFIGNPRNLSQ
jgi:ADP-ribose pyrophosphatase